MVGAQLSGPTPVLPLGRTGKVVLALCDGSTPLNSANEGPTWRAVMRPKSLLEVAWCAVPVPVVKAKVSAK